jgi:chorismate synthase
MSSTFGENLKLSIFGQSHGSAIGMVLDGIPAGLPVDTDALEKFLSRRAPGQGRWSTPRKEPDHPEFLGGIVDGFTCGAPIAAVIHNHNTRSSDYQELMDCPRPGHADFAAHVKYGGFEDLSGGGHFSGRLTAPLCIAGGLCKQWLEEMGIRIQAHIFSIGSLEDIPFDPLNPQIDMVSGNLSVINMDAGDQMMELIEEFRQKGNSVGGSIECAITGLPAGIGEPMFGGIESRIAQIIYGIPAVKGLSFGDIQPTGLENNDHFTVENGQIRTLTNHAGGILGGISNGMPVLFKVQIKPTPSIAATQQSISYSEMQTRSLNVSGRHDPCIVPRAVPVIEAAAAIAIYDLILGNTQTARRK